MVLTVVHMTHRQVRNRLSGSAGRSEQAVEMRPNDDGVLDLLQPPEVLLLLRDKSAELQS